MLVTPIQQDGSQSKSSSEQNSSGPAIKGLSQGDFLKLLLTQLQTQDPLKPLDNQEFAAQLATFNSLDQLMSINKKLDTTQGLQSSLSQLEATTLIGKDVQAKSDHVTLTTGSGTVLPYSLDGNASRVVINIRDSGGTLVRAIEAGSQNSGQQSVTWDGRDANGVQLASGQYTFSVTAVEGTGKPVTAETFLQGQVTGMNMTGSEAQLEVNGVSVPVSAVTSVRNAG
jgi:flagellar basal-body rod modification protein FlgD